MENYSDWQTATKPLYQKQNLAQKHGLFSEINVSPLSVEGGDELPRALPKREPCLNIVSPQRDVLTQEFFESANWGVFLDNEWLESLDGKNPFLYFKASPHITPFKRAILASDKFESINLGIDPYSLGLWKSTLYKSQIDQECFDLCLEKKSQAFRLHTQPYALAGASDVQQLAILLSSLVQVIKDYEGVLKPEQIFSLTSMEVALGPHIFLGLAKLEALKLLIARLAELLEVKERVDVFVSPSTRFFAAREPWNNILRFTAITAVAQMSGVKGVVSQPYDLLSKKPENYQISRNIAEILTKESHLQQVQEPTFGSYTQKDMVTELCEKSWQLFVELDNKEGLRSALRSGWLHDLIDEEGNLQTIKFQQGGLGVIGSNKFPLMNPLNEKYPLKKEEECLDGESWWVNQYTDEGADELCDVARLIPHTLSHNFEKWQFQADNIVESNGKRPGVEAFVEPGLEKSAKFILAKQKLSLAGLETFIHGEGRSKVALVVASDPEGEFAKEILSQLETHDFDMKLWAGEKQLEHFDGFVGSQSDLSQLFEKIFTTLGRGL